MEVCIRESLYVPQIGRFLSEDPIGFKSKDNNFYRYVKNQPIMRRDPTGRFAMCVAIPALSALDLALGLGATAAAALLIDEAVNYFNRNDNPNDYGNNPWEPRFDPGSLDPKDWALIGAIGAGIAAYNYREQIGNYVEE